MVKIQLFSISILLTLTACGINAPLTGQPSEEIQIMTASASSTSNFDWWHPEPGLTWQWQLDEELDTSPIADVYDVDLYVDQADIDELHARGVKVICYISVGSWEDKRPDADQFPEEVLGNDYEGWPGERWLDIRRIDLLAPIMLARLDLCRSKGFDGVEPDNIQIYDNRTGFPLSYQDQLNYARWLADAAHARGLAIGLKNAPDMVKDTLDIFDFAITEDAFYYHWIDQMLPFVTAGKAVFAAEYTDMPVDFSAACEWGKQHKINFIQKNRILTAFRITCP
jgi:hypothetical protein